MEEELNIFNDEGSERKEDGRKSEAIKDEDRSEDEEDDDDDDSIDGEGGKDLKEKAAKIKDAKKNKPKRKINIFRFKPDMLTNQDRGIKCLYENISKARIFTEGSSSSVKKEGETQKVSNVRFDEFKALDKLVSYYKEWHFHFMPKYDFKFFLDRCSFFGKNNLMKTYMNNVRRIHKGEINWADLLQDVDVDVDQNKDAQNQNNNGNPVSQQQGQQNNNNNNNNNNNLKIENRTISKQIKDTYLPNNTLNKSAAYNSSSLNHSTTFQAQSQETNPKNNISKNNNHHGKVNQDIEEPDDEMQRILNYEEELRILEEENLLAEVDQNESHPQNYYEEDDYRIDDQEDIQLKKRIQKEE